MALGRETVRHEGEHWTLPLPDGPGKALRLTVHPVRDGIPLYLAAVGPKNLELTGEIADGWLAIFFAPEHARRVAGPHQGRPREGRARTSTGFDVVPTVPVVVGDDLGGLRRAAAPLRRALRRRHGQPRAELLQPARRPDGLRARPRPKVQDLYLARQHRDAADGGAVRVHRPHVADRPEGAHPRPAGGVRRGRCDDAVGRLVRRLARGAGRGAAHPRGRAGRVRPRGLEPALLSWFEAAVLGVVQGLTEFLPISSSAHLRVVAELAGWEDPGAAFTAVTQLGTETAVLIYFRRDIARIVSTWTRSLWRPELRGEPDARMGWYVIVGTLPIGILGLPAPGHDRGTVPQPVADRVDARRLRRGPRRRRRRGAQREAAGAADDARRAHLRLRAGARAGPGRVAVGRHDQAPAC